MQNQTRHMMSALRFQRIKHAARKLALCSLSTLLACVMVPGTGFADQSKAANTDTEKPTSSQPAETTNSNAANTTAPTSETLNANEAKETKESMPTVDMEKVSVTLEFPCMVQVEQGVAALVDVKEDAKIGISLTCPELDATKTSLTIMGEKGARVVPADWEKDQTSADMWHAQLAVADVLTDQDPTVTDICLTLVTVQGASCQTSLLSEGSKTSITYFSLDDQGKKAEMQPFDSLILGEKAAIASQALMGLLSNDSSVGLMNVITNITLPAGYPTVNGVHYFPGRNQVPCRLYFDGQNVVSKTVTVNGVVQDNVTWGIDEDGGWATILYFDTPYQETVVTLTLEDAEGNKSVSTSDPFVLDVAEPEVTFSYDRVLNAAVVTIHEAYLDLEKTTVNDQVVPAEKWSVTQEANGIKAWRTSIPLKLDLDKHVVKVNAFDYSGRTTSIARTYDQADKEAWRTDSVAPKVTIVAEGNYAFTKDSADYFTDFKQMKVIVQEENLDTISIVTNVEGKITNEYMLQEQIGDHRVYVTEFQPEASGKLTSYMVTATDKAGNTTVYSYGQEAKNGNSTTDSSGRALSSSQFVLVDDAMPYVSGVDLIPIVESNSVKHAQRNGVDYFDTDMQVAFSVSDALSLDMEASKLRYGNATYSLSSIVDRERVDADRSKAYFALNYPVEGVYSLEITLVNIFGKTETVSYESLVKQGLVIYNKNVVSGTHFGIDMTAPVISISFDNNTSHNGSYYSGVRKAAIVVDDKSFAEDLISIDTTGTKQSWSDSGDGRHSIVVVFDEGTNHALKVSGTDLAGNAAESKSVEPFSVDATKPVISVDYDAHTENGYYSQTRTAVITVTEKNFNQQFMSIATSGAVGTWVDAGNDQHRLSVVFEEGQNHTLSVSGKDMADNAADAYTDPGFTVDTTSPMLQVSFDNDSVQNGKYYKAARNATITVTDTNFSEDGMQISTTGSVGSWWSSGDEHSMTVEFGSDGTYELSVAGQDLAGNSMDSYSSEQFVVDTTVPTITIQSLEEQKVYTQQVSPSISFNDEANFDSSTVSWTLTGSKNGDQREKLSVGVSDTGQGQVVSIQDFAANKNLDDVYTLTAQVSDLAGNSAQQSISFSVNRFGSSYQISASEGWAVGSVDPETGYCDLQWTGLGDPSVGPDITVREVNVAGCATDTQSVTITRDGDPLLTSSSQADGSAAWKKVGDDVAISSSLQDGWSVYDYAIPSSVFALDGEYAIYVTSTDASGNTRSSASYYDEEGKSASAVVRVKWNASDGLAQGGSFATKTASIVPYMVTSVIVLVVALAVIAYYFRRKDKEVRRLLQQDPSLLDD